MDFLKSYSRRTFNELIKAAPSRLQGEISKLFDGIVFKEDLEEYILAEDAETAISSQISASPQLFIETQPGLREIANGKIPSSIWIGEMDFTIFNYVTADHHKLVKIAALPPYSRVESCVSVVKVPAVHAASAYLLMNVGTTVGESYAEFLIDADIKSAANTVLGETDALAGAESYVDYYSSVTAKTDVYAYFTCDSGTTLSLTTAGRWEIILKYSVLK